MDNFVKDYNTDEGTLRTYQYERKYLTKSGEVRTSTTRTTRLYKPNATKRIRRTYNEEQKEIIRKEYELIKNYTATSRVINQKYDFTTSPHFIKKVVLEVK